MEWSGQSVEGRAIVGDEALRWRLQCWQAEESWVGDGKQEMAEADGLGGGRGRLEGAGGLEGRRTPWRSIMLSGRSGATS